MKKQKSEHENNNETENKARMSKSKTIAELTVPCSLRGKFKSDVYFTVVRISKKRCPKNNWNSILRTVAIK